MGMLGWLTWSIYEGIHKKKNPVRNLIIAGISGYILGIVKPYILFAYLPFYILFIVLTNIHLIKNTVLKGVAFVFIIAFSIGGFLLISDRLEEEMGFFAIEKLAESVKAQQRGFINMSDIAESSFSLGVEYDGSAGSLVRIAPAAINATLFRPYIWESKKVSTLLSSLESLMLMFFTLYVFYRAGPIRFFHLIIQKPMILFCFTYSIMFSLFIGATTLNFGTLVRYKIPAIPFYLIALILILHFCTAKKIRPAGKGGPSVVSE